MFAGIDMFWARLRAILAQASKWWVILMWVLTRVQNISLSKNINFVTHLFSLKDGQAACIEMVKCIPTWDYCHVYLFKLILAKFVCFSSIILVPNTDDISFNLLFLLVVFKHEYLFLWAGLWWIWRCCRKWRAFSVFETKLSNSLI